VAIVFVEELGPATNMSPGTDPNDPASLEQDPVYRASQNIIRKVTEVPATMDAPLMYLAGTRQSTASTSSSGRSTERRARDVACGRRLIR